MNQHRCLTGRLPRRTFVSVMALQVGKVTHYYDQAGVAVVELKRPLAVGQEVSFQRGEDVLFSQVVQSMQIEHENIERAKSGDTVGIKVDQKVKPGTVMLRLVKK